MQVGYVALGNEKIKDTWEYFLEPWMHGRQNDRWNFLKICELKLEVSSLAHSSITMIESYGLLVRVASSFFST